MEVYKISLPCGYIGLIQTRCFAEAKFKAENLKGIVKGKFTKLDYIIIKQINQ